MFENFTPTQWIAFIFMAIAAIKIIVILISPKAWYNNVAKPIWKRATLMMVVCLVLAAIVLYYLLQSGINIVQIFAVTAFVVLVMAAGAAIYVKDIISLATRMIRDKSLVKKSWLYILIWVVLIIWGAKVLFNF
ncbi:MAG: hypothetical protein WCP89_00240 [archaeon]